MEEVELEYQRVKLSKHLLDFISKGLDRRQKYEAHNVLERWLLSLYNEYGLPGEGELLPTPTDSRVDDQAAQEILEKGIRKTLEGSRELIIFLWEQVDQFEQNLALRPGTIRINQESIIYKDEKIRLTQRISYLLRRWPQTKVVRMLFRYESVLPGGQQWGIPWPAADFLYDLGFRNEGFASPLNSRLIDKLGTRFCSLFEDTDSIFGSIGSFFKVRLSDYPGDWIVNPPYIASMFDPILEQVETYLKDAQGRVFVLLPYWTDTRIYQELSRSPWLVTQEVMPAGTYYYHGPNREVIIPPKGGAVYFILGNPLPREDLAQLRELWKPPH